MNEKKKVPLKEFGLGGWGVTRKSLLEGGFIFNSGFEIFQKGGLEKKGVKKIEGGVTLKD